MLRDVVTGGTGTGAAEVAGPRRLRQDRHHRRTQRRLVHRRNRRSWRTAVWFGNWRTTKSGIRRGFGGDSAAPVFQAFMTEALGRPPATSRCRIQARCARRPSQNVIDTGGRTDNPRRPVRPARSPRSSRPCSSCRRRPPPRACGHRSDGARGRAATGGNGNGNGNGVSDGRARRAPDAAGADTTLERLLHRHQTLPGTRGAARRRAAGRAARRATRHEPSRT